MSPARRLVLELPSVSCKTFADGGRNVEVLRGVDLEVAKGERVAIVGASGSGKSTLLQLARRARRSRPTGEVRVAGESMSRAERRRARPAAQRALGFVYQFHHLLPEFTALENVAMPLLIRGAAPARRGARRRERCSSAWGSAQRLEHRPGELSGGERQRAAVARALVTRPPCVLARRADRQPRSAHAAVRCSS